MFDEGALCHVLGVRDDGLRKLGAGTRETGTGTGTGTRMGEGTSLSVIEMEGLSPACQTVFNACLDNPPTQR